MIRYLAALITLCSMVGLIAADPIKKAPKIENDKISKECADKFFKALLAGNAEEAIKLMAMPFRDNEGVKHESPHKIKQLELDRIPPTDIKFEIIEVCELSKFNEFLKKGGDKELSADEIKDIGVYMGQDGRIVGIKIKNPKQPDLSPRYLLIRVSDGKAHIVGIIFGKYK